MKNSDEWVRQEMVDQAANRSFAGREGEMAEVKAHEVINAATLHEPTAAGNQVVPLDHKPLVSALPLALKDNCHPDGRLDQYYTQMPVAAYFYGVFREHFDPALYRMVEPSAGTGSFYKLLPAGSLGYDVEPKYPGIETVDFLTVKIAADRKIAIIGNPPFGKNASMAVRFFNHAAPQSSVIALILPRSFRKASIRNRLNRDFHLVWEEMVPQDAFLFEGKPYNVPAAFQIWERRDVLRTLMPVETKHPDFEFTTPDRANFAIQRVGARAGQVHHDLSASPSSHYFIWGNVEAIMAQLDFVSVVGNVAGNPSLAKSEIVSLYCEFISISVPLGRSKASESAGVAMNSDWCGASDNSTVEVATLLDVTVTQDGVIGAVNTWTQHSSCTVDALSRAGLLVAGISAHYGETIHSRCSRGITDYRRHEVATGAGRGRRSTSPYPKGPPNAQRSPQSSRSPSCICEPIHADVRMSPLTTARRSSAARTACVRSRLRSYWPRIRRRKFCRRQDAAWRRLG